MLQAVGRSHVLYVLCRVVGENAACLDGGLKNVAVQIYLVGVFGVAGNERLFCKGQKFRAYDLDSRVDAVFIPQALVFFGKPGRDFMRVRGHAAASFRRIIDLGHNERGVVGVVVWVRHKACERLFFLVKVYEALKVYVKNRVAAQEQKIFVQALRLEQKARRSKRLLFLVV